MASTKALMLTEIANFTNDLKLWSGWKPIEWGPITISKLEEDLIEVSTIIGDFSFYN